MMLWKLSGIVYGIMHFVEYIQSVMNEGSVPMRHIPEYAEVCGMNEPGGLFIAFLT